MASTASKRLNGEATGLSTGWYKGKLVSYFSFFEKTVSKTDGMVPLSPIYVTFNTNGEPSTGFISETGTMQTHNVIATIPSDDNYSPLWSVNVYNNADFWSVMDINSAEAANILAEGAAKVNCPVVFISDRPRATTGSITLDISGLEDLGDGYIYEGWIIVDGTPVTTGTFDVNENGALSETTFAIDREKLANATTFVLTIEPMPDSDPAPSKVHILGGDISGNSGMLSVGHATALANDFANAMGKYILATPTNDVDTDENSGVWFLDNSSGTAVAGLSLPTLPEGWEYEGWAVIDGQPVTTGKFTAVDAADMASPFSGANAGPAYPGEDFLMNAPSGLMFPVDLSESTVVISIEPVPDNSEAPFLLKPLRADVPANAEVHSVYDMGNISGNTNPTGSVSIDYSM